MPMNSISEFRGLIATGVPAIAAFEKAMSPEDPGFEALIAEAVEPTGFSAETLRGHRREKDQGLNGSTPRMERYHPRPDTVLEASKAALSAAYQQQLENQRMVHRADQEGRLAMAEAHAAEGVAATEREASNAALVVDNVEEPKHVAEPIIEAPNDRTMFDWRCENGFTPEAALRAATIEKGARGPHTSARQRAQAADFRDFALHVIAAGMSRSQFGKIVGVPKTTLANMLEPRKTTKTRSKLAAQERRQKAAEKRQGLSGTNTPASPASPPDAPEPGGKWDGEELPALPYGPNAAWNIPVSSLRDHGRSASLVNRLFGGMSNHVNVTFDTWTYAVYDISDATGLFPVEVAWRTALHGTEIPWNPDWQVPRGSDGQVILLDPATGREWNLWQVRFRNGTVYASNGNLVPGSYWTREVGFFPSRGAGIQYLAMLVRPEEVASGDIGHALSMVIENTSGRKYVAPATKLEHDHGLRGVPEGMRFALTVTDAEIEDWIDTLPSELPEATIESARVIARALRDYGWFITDTGGSPHLQFEDYVSAGEAWAELGLDSRTIDWKVYPRDLLDGLLTPDRVRAIVPSNRYPRALRAAAIAAKMAEIKARSE